MNPEIRITINGKEYYFENVYRLEKLLDQNCDDVRMVSGSENSVRVSEPMQIAL